MSHHSAVTRPAVSALTSYRAESEKDFIECRPRPVAARSNYDSPSLGERNEAKVKDEILAIVVYELRGPLAPLRLAAEVIRRASPDRTDVLRMVDTIERADRRYRPSRRRSDGRYQNRSGITAPVQG
jgi:signal transduction histidine kinase